MRFNSHNNHSHLTMDEFNDFSLLSTLSQNKNRRVLYPYF